jgi:hypothetical protein
MSTAHDDETLEGFVIERSAWFVLGVLANQWDSFDVVLRLDGSYSVEADAWHVARWLHQRLAAVLPAQAQRQWRAQERELHAELIGHGTWGKDLAGAARGSAILRVVGRAIQKAEREYRRQQPDAAAGECWHEVEQAVDLLDETCPGWRTGDSEEDA